MAWNRVSRRHCTSVHDDLHQRIPDDRSVLDPEHNASDGPCSSGIRCGPPSPAEYIPIPRRRYARHPSDATRLAELRALHGQWPASHAASAAFCGNAGMVHVDDQTVNDDANNPFGGPGVAGAGAAVGGPADIEEYTAWQWAPVKDTPPQNPFWAQLRLCHSAPHTGDLFTDNRN